MNAPIDPNAASVSASANTAVNHAGYLLPPTYMVPPLRLPWLNQWEWDAPAWKDVTPQRITHFQERSTTHRPLTEVKVIYTATHLHLLFEVHDQYVRSVQAAHQTSTCRDSCVEFFVQPLPQFGYFNFELNAGGFMALEYHVPNEKNDAAQKMEKIFDARKWVQGLTIFHSLPTRIDPELTAPTLWRAGFSIPFALFESVLGPLNVGAKTQWRANFYKCGNDCSMPHWGMWAPVHGPSLSFHQPQFFGRLLFT